jgi:phosphorylcholine metabolism protein LicD
MKLLRSIAKKVIDYDRRQELRQIVERWSEFGLARYCPWLFKSRFPRSVRSIVEHLKLRRAFRSRWTAVSLTDALRLVDLCDQVFREGELSYMAYAGTLLGIERHGGVIPWDDDIDFCIEGRDLPKLLRLQERFAALGIRLIANEMCYKLCWNRHRPIGRKTNWSWPFIDVFVWDEFNERLLVRYTGDHYPFESVFPLRDAHFHHLLLPVPRDAQSILAAWFGPNFMTRAVSPVFLHRKERPIRGKPLITTYPLPTGRPVLSGQRMLPRQLCELLFRTGTDFLKCCGIEFWADFGTLLGAYRYRSLLPHEHNIDISMMEESVPALFRNLHRLDPDFEFSETTRDHRGPKFEIGHRTFGGTCDFYTYRRLENLHLRICLGDRWRGTLDARDIPEEMIFPLQPTRIDGVVLMRPRRMKEYLTHRYGYLGNPAVLKDDGSGHYRKISRQEPLPASKLTASGAILVNLGDSLSTRFGTSE